MGLRSRRRRRSDKAANQKPAGKKSGGGVATGVAKAAGSLLVADLARRGASLLAGQAIQHSLTRSSEKRTARSAAATLATAGAARIATRSIPGFLAVASGLVAVAVVERSLKRRRRSDRKRAK